MAKAYIEGDNLFTGENTFEKGFDVDSNKITSLATPIDSDDGANKYYADDAITSVSDYDVVAVYTDTHEPVYRQCEANERELLFIEYEGVFHFVCGDGKGQIKWDPYSAKGSKTARLGEVKSKRSFTIKGWIA